MSVLGKRTRGEANSMKDKREALNRLKQYHKQLNTLLPQELCSKVLPVIENWDPKGNIFVFYTKNAHRLRNLEFEHDFILRPEYGIWEDENMLHAAKTWNSVVDELATHFNWKNKNTPICV